MQHVSPTARWLVSVEHLQRRLSVVRARQVTVRVASVNIVPEGSEGTSLDAVPITIPESAGYVPRAHSVLPEPLVARTTYAHQSQKSILLNWKQLYPF